MGIITTLYQIVLITHALFLSFLLLRDIDGSDKIVLMFDLFSVVVFPLTAVSLRKWFSNKSQTGRVLLLLGATGIILLSLLIMSIYNHGYYEINLYSLIAGLIFLWTISYFYYVITRGKAVDN
jgi:hypothetical protein